MSLSPPIIPNYMTRGAATVRPLAIFPARLALSCGIVPASLGTLALIGWVVSGHPYFAIFGGFVILLGVGLAGLGGICLVTHYVRTAARRDAKRAGRWKPLRIHWVAAIFLIGNFPLALGYFRVAAYADRFYRVTIRNEATTPVDEMTVDFRSRRLQVHHLKPGDSASFYVNLRNSGWPEYDLTQGGLTTHGSPEEPHNKFGMHTFRSDQLILIGSSGVTIQTTENSRQHLP